MEPLHCAGSTFPYNWATRHSSGHDPEPQLCCRGCNATSMLAVGHSCTPDAKHAGLSEASIACTTTSRYGPHQPSSICSAHLTRTTVNGLASKVVSPVESPENHRTCERDTDMSPTQASSLGTNANRATRLHIGCEKSVSFKFESAKIRDGDLSAVTSLITQLSQPSCDVMSGVSYQQAVL